MQYQHIILLVCRRPPILTSADPHLQDRAMAYALARLHAYGMHICRPLTDKQADHVLVATPDMRHLRRVMVVHRLLEGQRNITVGFDDSDQIQALLVYVADRDELLAIRRDDLPLNALTMTLYFAPPPDLHQQDAQAFPWADDYRNLFRLTDGWKRHRPPCRVHSHCQEQALHFAQSDALQRGFEVFQAQSYHLPFDLVLMEPFSDKMLRLRVGCEEMRVVRGMVDLYGRYDWRERRLTYIKAQNIPPGQQFV